MADGEVIVLLFEIHRLANTPRITTAKTTPATILFIKITYG
ncbi:hypothetical protein TERMP_00835 [Thermococcus barophilus MP]|uniref:Uncharacterized protein n=1 Tax=Thermococcus barophilus (strain DSM 11836 / MP) TaxID=391623 RepID=F0LLN5_THEBM|nr:hypothetical protein TERMP_00835 [Thermococcus barophilus MP]